MSTLSFVRRTASAGAAVAVLALTLAACSSSSSSPSGGGSSAASSSSDIVIGYAASESGPQSSNGINGAAAAVAWQDATNAAGGIDGHRVRIRITDTKNSVPGATSAVKSFQDDTSVDAIMLTDLVADASMKDSLQDQGIAMLSGGGGGDASWYGVPGTFTTVTANNYTTKVYVQLAKSGGATTVGWAACAEVAICAQSGGVAEKYAPTIGMEFGGVQAISASASSYTAQCLAFQGKGVNGIATDIGVDTGVRVMADCIQQGYKGVWSMENAAFDPVKVGKVADAKVFGSIQGFPWWANAAPAAAYRDAMTKYSAKTPYANSMSTSVWSMLEMLKKALTDARPATIDRATVLDALYGVKNETLGGLLPQPITYSRTTGSPVLDCSWFFRFTSGDKDPVSVPPTGTSGNGASGDLATTCVPFDES